MKHVVTWHTASPLWALSLQDSGAAPKRFEQPALLSFVGDTFMDEIQQILATEPTRLAAHVVRRESFSTGKFDRAGWVSEAQLANEPPLKLYQPAHNRYYLAAANLVCRERGLPERTLDVAAGERASFVMRRLTPISEDFDPEQDSTFDEYAWVGDRQQGAWVRQPVKEAIAAGEERLPAFPLTFKQDGQSRRLLAGMPPVGSREIYESGRAPLAAADVAGDFLADLRLVTFRESVLLGFEQLRDMPSDAADTATEDDEARLSLAFVLLDFVEFLENEIPPLAAAVDARSPAGLNSDSDAVYDFLDSFQPVPPSTWIALLDDIAANRSQILLGNLPAALLIKQPTFDRGAIKTAASQLLQVNGDDYRLAQLMAAALGDPRKATWRDLVEQHIGPLSTLPGSYTASAATAELLEALLPLDEWLALELSKLWAGIFAGSSAGLSAQELSVYSLLESQTVRGLTWRAILADAEKNRAAILASQIGTASALVRNGFTANDVRAFAAALQASALDDRINAVLDAVPIPPPAGSTETPPVTFYKVRFVYDRPNCGRATPPLVSKPSPAFELASFFDSEAPVRQLRIQMPLDTTIAGLRASPKNFSVVISDELRKQMGRAQAAGMQGLMDGDVPEGGLPGLGMICSFSIPIITICALILLMIIVQLLNIIFWWLPLFRICLPIPVKAK